MVQYRSSLILLAAVNLSTAFQVPRSNSYIPPKGSLDASVVERDMIFDVVKEPPAHPVAEQQKKEHLKFCKKDLESALNVSHYYYYYYYYY